MSLKVNEKKNSVKFKASVQNLNNEVLIQWYLDSLFNGISTFMVYLILKQSL